jgi:hypothetical protein
MNPRQSFVLGVVILSAKKTTRDSMVVGLIPANMRAPPYAQTVWTIIFVVEGRHLAKKMKQYNRKKRRSHKKTEAEIDAELINSAIKKGEPAPLDTVKRWSCKELGTTFAEVLIGASRNIRSKKLKKVLFERVLWTAFDSVIFEIRKDIDDMTCDCIKINCEHTVAKINIKHALIKRVSNYYEKPNGKSHYTAG